MSRIEPIRNEGFLKKIFEFCDKLSFKSSIARTMYGSATIFLVAIILIPPTVGVTLKWDLLDETLRNPTLVSRAQSAILSSFAIAFIVAFLDLLAGLPTAWLIVRKKSKWINLVDTLIDIPFIIPTVALGFSTLTFWSLPEGISSLFKVESLVSPGARLIILLHFAFSYPIIVRVLVGELQGYDQTHEIVARTLGASTFTSVRTVTLPILKPALISAYLLAFCRSLSETGATVIVAGVFENGPVFIQNARVANQEGPMVLVSLVLIASACAIFAIISFLGPKLKFPIKKVWPRFEKSLSSSRPVRIRNILSLIFFGFFVAVPSLFIALPAILAFFDGTIIDAIRGIGVWSDFWMSLVMSYAIGLAATLMNIIIGFPMAIVIARRKLGHRITAILDALINIPIIIPSIALGVSLNVFWTSFGSVPEILVLILVHTTITYPYFTRVIAASIESIPEELEDVARTLGASPFEVFRKIIFPLTKYSFLSGAIMVLTRSVDETGATLAVVKQITTVPVLLVNWITNPQKYSSSTVGLGIFFLVLTAFVSLISFRIVFRRRE